MAEAGDIGPLLSRPLSMPHGRWCNPPKVTRNGIIADSDDHLSAPFRRTQGLVLSGCASTDSTSQSRRSPGHGGRIHGGGAKTAFAPFATCAIRDPRLSTSWLSICSPCSNPCVCVWVRARVLPCHHNATGPGASRLQHAGGACKLVQPSDSACCNRGWTDEGAGRKQGRTEAKQQKQQQQQRLDGQY